MKPPPTKRRKLEELEHRLREDARSLDRTEGDGASARAQAVRAEAGEAQRRRLRLERRTKRDVNAMQGIARRACSCRSTWLSCPRTRAGRGSASGCATRPSTTSCATRVAARAARSWRARSVTARSCALRAPPCPRWAGSGCSAAPTSTARARAAFRRVPEPRCPRLPFRFRLRLLLLRRRPRPRPPPRPPPPPRRQWSSV